ncbi:ABC transporter permease [Tepidimicrobium xylanilyticum]|uniref:NitT/TauT family transport system permease protein n=1 Tax=Tepidimicrobium xylanilyticum TaxID=1123352 RepID=A0A1H2VHS3_9FIRM|nr:ABC transporter permease subunit [Tepidimicrobium xylanilyticum]GMG96636.1 ABC transporter permease [Tepidimicrobium xylanilyticum]SDW67760.1 NitT/TauT family transport system permease protein [Tepidimicrobium xylanilyticum]
MKIYSLKGRKFSLISKGIIIIFWTLLSRIVDNEVIFPTVKSTIASLINIIKGRYFFSIIKYSLFRSLVGFIISLVLAIFIGVLASVFKMVHHLMVPVTNFLSSVPTMAIIILALIWLDNEVVPLFVGFIMIFPILYETVLKSIKNVDKDIIEMARFYKVDRIYIIKYIYIPSILYSLSNVFSSTLGLNLKMVIAGEALSQPNYGIGNSLQLEKTYLNTSAVFAWIIIILLISKLLEFILNRLDNLFHINDWKG